MDISTPYMIAILGFFFGGAIGAITRWTRFCTLGAIEDTVLANRYQRLKIWALSIAVSVIIVQSFRYLTDSRLDESFYLSADFNLLGAILGGLLFGFGMALVGTCAYGSLVRLGGGDLKSLVTSVIIGLTAYMTMRGLTGVIRVEVIEYFKIDLTVTGGQGIPDIVSYLTGININYLLVPLALAIAIPLVYWCYFRAHQTLNFRDTVVGIIIGVIIAAGFIVTSELGNDPFDPQRVESLAYVRPLGESIVYLLTYSGAVINFSIASVFGTLFGSFLAAYFKKEIRIEAFDDAVEMKRHLIGACFMGFGAVTASGCTIGQGISAMSTLSLNAPIAMISIFLGATFGLHYLLSSNMKEAFELFFRYFRLEPARTKKINVRNPGN